MLADLKRMIDTAVRNESSHQQLRRHLERELPRLRQWLILPEQQPLSALLQFVTRYIQSVPTSISLITSVSRRLGCYEYTAPFLHMAQDYFVSPPDDIAPNEGLQALLDEAFLAHRLLEEVNDRHRAQLQRTLLPVDMTESNVIVHHLVGDPLATRLEHLVQFAVDRLMQPPDLWQKLRACLPSDAPAEDELSSTALGLQTQSIRLRLPAVV
jgi:hypothetical protein